MLLGEYVFYAKHSTTMIIIYMLIYIFAWKNGILHLLSIWVIGICDDWMEVRIPCSSKAFCDRCWKNPKSGSTNIECFDYNRNVHMVCKVLSFLRFHCILFCSGVTKSFIGVLRPFYNRRLPEQVAFLKREA